MKKFTCVQDIGDLKSALAEAFEIKKDRFKYVELGRNKTLMMIFFNSSLHHPAALCTQKKIVFSPSTHLCFFQSGLSLT